MGEDLGLEAHLADLLTVGAGLLRGGGGGELNVLDTEVGERLSDLHLGLGVKESTGELLSLCRKSRSVNEIGEKEGEVGGRRRKQCSLRTRRAGDRTGGLPRRVDSMIFQLEVCRGRRRATSVNQSLPPKNLGEERLHLPPASPEHSGSTYVGKEVRCASVRVDRPLGSGG
jgi:hypothetical protein